MSTDADDPLTQERLERALVTLAYIVTRHGPQYGILLESLEQELEKFKKRQDPLARARRILENYTIDGGLKAIR